MYADQMDEGHRFVVNNKAEETAALEKGCRVLPPFVPPPPAGWNDEPLPPPPKYPKTMLHPGYPNGAATGLLVKDYPGKDANQHIVSVKDRHINPGPRHRNSSSDGRRGQH